MACNCSNIPTQFQIPNETLLRTMSVGQLRQYANIHSIGADGVTASGTGGWRATASKDQLIMALLGHKSGTIPNASTGPILQNPLSPNPGAPKIEDAIKQLIAASQPTINPEMVNGMVNKAVKKAVDEARSSFMQVQVVVQGQPPVMVGRQHKSFPALVKLVGSCENVLMVGPAGSSKTTSALAAAKAVGREYEIISVGPQTMQSELAGYKNAAGTYIESIVRRCYQNGKVLILDEIDAANPGVFTYMNAIIDNAHAGFPDGTIDRHETFSVVACANTWGTGADMLYVGRSQLDAATLDRFTALEWNYDEQFEMDLALGQNPNAKEWVLKVQKWRANMFKHKIRHVISPRASIKGAKLLKLGFTEAQVQKMVVFKGLNKEAYDKIMQEA